MLMSLTMRLRPSCPLVPCGATSVVAIPTPSFDFMGRSDPPEFTARGNLLLYGAQRALSITNWPPDAGRNLFGNEKMGPQDSVLKNWAMVRNLLYRETIKSAGGIFFSSEKCFCRLTSSKFA